MWNKFFFIFGWLVLGVSGLKAQELKCNISVISQKIQGTNRELFSNMQRDLYEFLNNKHWSEHVFAYDERIECSLQLVLNEQIGSDQFKGTLQVRVSRPVYNSSYSTTLLTFRDNDIDFSHMTTNVTQTFMGRLDGNGHKIIGNTFPIFNKIRYGYVGNIKFENTNIPKTISNAGALSYRSEMSTIEKIDVSNLKMNFGGRNDLSLIGGTVSNVVTRDCTVEKLTYHITSADDMAKLNEDPSGIYILDNDQLCKTGKERGSRDEIEEHAILGIEKAIE